MVNQNLTYLYFMMTIVAIGCTFMAATIFWVARSLISGSLSLKKLIETIDRNVQTSVNMLQSSITDINKITQRSGEQMDSVESIVGDAQQVAKDARTSVQVIEETLVPTMTNLHAISAGLRKGLNTWRGSGAEAPLAPPNPQNQNPD